MDTLPEHSNTRRDLYLEKSCNANFSYKISFTAVVPEHNIWSQKFQRSGKYLCRKKCSIHLFFFFFKDSCGAVEKARFQCVS